MYRQSNLFLEKIIKENINNLWKINWISIIIVSHILPDKLDFIQILSKYFKIEFIIPKPKSIDKNTFDKLKNEFDILQITRDEIYKNQEIIFEKIKNIQNKIIIIDIWWYFSKIIKKLEEKFNNKIIWIIEDTENWHQKYEKIIKNISIPIISVARSVLKNWEDFLIWQSIVFSTDYVLRLNNILLHNKYAGIIWFWKIWKSIAIDLKWKNIQLWINDINPYKWIEVLTYWYNFLSKEELFTKSDIIFLATWNYWLKWEDFENLKNNVILASVTSSDDEININYLIENFETKIINEYTTKYTKNWKNIYLLYWWNAINFINNAVVWEFIYLVQAEIIHIIFKLYKKNWLNNENNSIYSIENNEKIYIPQLWLKYFI